MKSSSGVWLIDYADDGFGAWNASISGYTSSGVQPVPADYDGDGHDDIGSFFTSTNYWKVDYASDGFNGSYDLIKTDPSTSSLNYLSLPVPQFERAPAFENVVAPEEESIIDVYDLYGRQILRGAKLQHLEKLDKGYYLIVTKQGVNVYVEKCIVR